MSDLIARVEIDCLEQFDGKARNKVDLDRDSNQLMTDLRETATRLRLHHCTNYPSSQR